MATIHRRGYRAIKRGDMIRPSIVHDDVDYSLANAIAGTEEDPYVAAESQDVDEKVAWLRKDKPLLAQVVDLHVRGVSLPDIGKKLGKTTRAASRLYGRGINLLRWKYAGIAVDFSK
jgi:hypothetical protein